MLWENGFTTETLRDLIIINRLSRPPLGNYAIWATFNEMSVWFKGIVPLLSGSMAYIRILKKYYMKRLFTFALLSAVLLLSGCIKHKENVIPVTGVELNENAIKLCSGETYTLTATVHPANADNRAVEWSSSDEKVASVAEGLVRAEAEGTAVVSVKTVDGAFTATCSVTVEDKAPLVPEEQKGGTAEGDDYSYKLSDNSALVSEDMMKHISEASPQGFTVDFPSLDGSGLAQGDILFFPPCEQYPEGYAARITGSQSAGDKTIVTTELAPLNEVFETLHLKVSSQDITEHIDRIMFEGQEVPVTKAGTAFTIEIPQILGIDANFNIGPGCTVTPKFSFRFSLYMECDIDWFTVNSFKARIEEEFGFQCSFACKAEGSLRPLRIGEFLFSSTVPIMVGGVIPVSPAIHGVLVIEPKGEISLNTDLDLRLGAYAECGYTSGSGVYTDCGLLSPPADYTPVKISGALSGGIEVGPDMGIGARIAGGALDFMLDLKPRLKAYLSSSTPFNAETLLAICRGDFSYAMGNAYFEPSIGLQFGGYLGLGWNWTKTFDFPGDLSHSFGKYYLVPRLAPVNARNEYMKLSGRPDNNLVKIEMNRKGMNLFGEDIFINLVERTPNPKNPAETWITKTKVMLESGTPPQNDDETVACTAVLNGLKKSPVSYSIEGPFTDVSLFGETYPIPLYDGYNGYGSWLTQGFSLPEYPFEKTRELLLDILDDCDPESYQTEAEDGKSIYCNWKDPDAISFSDIYYSDHYDEEDVKHLLLFIQPPGRVNDVVSVSDHNLPFWWELRQPYEIDGKPQTIRSFTVEDKTFFGTDAYVSEKMVIHSPAFGKDSQMVPYSPDLELLDLSETSIVDLHLSGPKGDLILDNCPKLKYLDFGHRDEEKAPVFPKSMSATGVRFTHVGVDARNMAANSLSFLQGSQIDGLTISGTSSADLIIPSCKTIGITGLYWPDQQDDIGIQGVSISGLDELTELIIRNVHSISIFDCPSLKQIHIWVNPGFQITTLSAAGLPGLTSDYSFQVHDVSGPAPYGLKSTASSCPKLSYPHRYNYTWEYYYDEHGTRRRRNMSFWDYNKGWYYPGEPNQGYHVNSSYDAENDNY